MALKDVKDHLSEVVDQVEREHDRVVITKHGRPAAVVLSVIPPAIVYITCQKFLLQGVITSGLKS